MKRTYDYHLYRFGQSFAPVREICPFTVFFRACRLSILEDNGAFDGIRVDRAVINWVNVTS
ncbi:hypothetical protein D1BOALGB6SA_4206 [Olavius sp. associated proteobacterium Delta 1]|nr:hypothetical protein D1BOALGB6SA_4206 [Olavius sp. associated proteobacterium Delta 1]